MQQQPQKEEEGRPLGFYFLMAFLTFLTSFIGWNFAGVIGLIVGFLFSCLINGYALRIKFD